MPNLTIAVSVSLDAYEKIARDTAAGGFRTPAAYLRSLAGVEGVPTLAGRPARVPEEVLALARAPIGRPRAHPSIIVGPPRTELEKKIRNYERFAGVPEVTLSPREKLLLADATKTLKSFKMLNPDGTPRLEPLPASACAENLIPKKRKGEGR